MDNNCEHFLQSGKALNLSLEEKETIRMELHEFLRQGAVSSAGDVRHLKVMDPVYDQFLRSAQAETLDPEEKMLTKIRLRAFMHAHPCRSAPSVRAFFSFSFQRLTAITTSVALIAAAGGGVSYAAEDSMPGDGLYPVKRYVNERVMVALAFDAETKAETHSRLMQRRLWEIEALAVHGKASADIEDIGANLAYHINAAQENIAALSKEKPDAATAERARLESELEAHATVLSQLQNTSAPDLRPFLISVSNAVTTAAKAASDRRTENEGVDPSVSRVSAEASLNESERGIREAQRTLDRMHGKADPRSLLRAKKVLDEAERELTSGRATLEAQGFDEAFKNGKNARRRIEESRMITNGADADTFDDGSRDSGETASVSSSTSISSSAAVEVEVKQRLDAATKRLP